MAEKAIQKTEKKGVKKIAPMQLTPEDVKKYVCPNATDKEIFLFLQVAKSCKLNPFLKEIYLVKYKEDTPAQILTSYNVYLQRAEKSGVYAGLETATEGSVKNGDLKGIVKVYRKDWERPLVHEAHYDEYVQMVYDKYKKTTRPNKFWGEKPKTMIVKVAISQAFRLAFPLAFEGMPYTSDEINTVDIPVEKPKAEKPKAKVKEEPIETPEVEEADYQEETSGEEVVDPDPPKEVKKQVVTKNDKLLKIQALAKLKFPDPDTFVAWRVDNALPESINKATDKELLEIYQKLKELPDVNV